MKVINNFYKVILATTGTILTLGSLETNPIQAASFNFSYAFESGELLSGMVDGDLENDGNTVSNLTNLMATYSGLPDITFDNLIFGNSSTATLDGSANLFGGSDIFPFNLGTFFFATDTVNSNISLVQVTTEELPDGGFLTESLDEEVFNPESWSMSVKSTVPEPSTILSLLTIGGIALSVSKKKQS